MDSRLRGNDNQEKGDPDESPTKKGNVGAGLEKVSGGEPKTK